MFLISRSLFKSALLALGLGMANALPAAAQGDLLVAPTRLVINGGGSAQVVLNNIGAEPATYRISLELRRMLPDGTLEDIEEADYTPEQRARLDMFRHAPRRILLAPNQPQSVRISVRPPEGLPDGEYRVHMSFRAIPPAIPADAAPPVEGGGFSIRLTPIYGVAIPVILRRGALTGSATIANPALVREEGQAFFNLDIMRSGNRSAYGEVRVVAPGVKEPVFLVRGIAVYPEVDRRKLHLQLSPAQAAAFKGPMQIEYREMPEYGGRLIHSIAANF